MKALTKKETELLKFIKENLKTPFMSLSMPARKHAKLMYSIGKEVRVNRKTFLSLIAKKALLSCGLGVNEYGVAYIRAELR